MQTSESIKELAAALAKAQGQIEGAKKDSKNEFYKSNYADLESCREAMRKPFADNGLALTQNPHSRPAANGEEQLYLSAMLLHSSGEWIKYDDLFCGVKDKSAQSAKSSVTLLRRMQLLAICNMSEADDDGNADVRKPDRPVQQQTSRAPQPPAPTKTLPNLAPTGQAKPANFLQEMKDRHTK